MTISEELRKMKDIQKTIKDITKKMKEIEDEEKERQKLLHTNGQAE